MMGGLQLSENEKRYYQQLFTLADAEGTGYVGGIPAFNFFSTSGVDKGVLKQIWDIADFNQSGFIGPDGFSVVLRLIAQAQAGAVISQEMSQFEPPTLAFFQGLPPPDLGNFASSGSFGGPSNFSGGAAFGGMGSSASRGRSRERGQDSSTPTSRDMRKYARLFLKVDTDQDGKIFAQEAQELFLRSGVDQQSLAVIWEQSDVDRDGYLCWPEFVLAMHLIRRVRAKVALPSAGLPNEITQFLANVDSPQNYAAQHSRSRSPGAVSAVTSAGDASWSPVRTDLGATAAFGTEPFNSMTGPSSGFGQQGFDTGVPEFGTQSPKHSNDGWPDAGQSAPGFGFGDGMSTGFDVGPSSPSSKRDRRRNSNRDHKDRHRDRDNDLPSGQLPDSSKTMAPASLDSGFDFSKPSPSKRRDHVENTDDGYSPDFGRRHRHRPRLPEAARHDADPVEHIEVLIEADKVLVQGLRHDVDELDEELTRLEEACRFEEREASRERAEVERVGQERHHLTQQLAASQRQLSELKVEHEGIVLENVMLRCDHDHFNKEAIFLRRLLDEATRDAQALQQSTEYLEQSNSSLRSHTKTLEEARREVLDTVRVEKDLLRKESQEAQFAQKALEALRIDGIDGLMRVSHSRPSLDNRPMIPADGVQRSRGATGMETSNHGAMGFSSPAPGGTRGFQSSFATPTMSPGSQPTPMARDGFGGNYQSSGQGQRAINLQREREGV
jgi:hypothetical protein